MRIRKAEADDIKTLQAIARRVIRHNYTPFLGDAVVSHFIKSGSSDKEIVEGIEHCHVMQEENLILGYAVFMGELLHLLMVDVPYQRKGYGANLLAYAEREMFKGHSVIRLQTFDQNAAAVRFYEKNGWVIGRKEQDDEIGMMMLHMEKQCPL